MYIVSQQLVSVVGIVLQHLQQPNNEVESSMNISKMPGMEKKNRFFF